MKSHFLFFMVLVGTIMNVQAQNKVDTAKQVNFVHLNDYFKEKGVIFSKDYIVGINMRQLQSRYTPTMADVIKAEQIFSKKYNEVQRQNVDAKKFFCHWVRHYVGLIDNNGNKNIIMQLIDNTKPHKIKRLLGKGWEDIFIIMLADSFYEVSAIFRINIDTSNMSTQL